MVRCRRGGGGGQGRGRSGGGEDENRRRARPNRGNTKRTIPPPPLTLATLFKHTLLTPYPPARPLHPAPTNYRDRNSCRHRHPTRRRGYRCRRG
jgi:hypothetical protein